MHVIVEVVAKIDYCNDFEVVLELADEIIIIIPESRVEQSKQAYYIDYYVDLNELLIKVI